MKKIFLVNTLCLIACLYSCTKVDKISNQVKSGEFTIIEGKGFY